MSDMEIVRILLALVIALAGGLLSTRIVKIFHLPNVTGYLVMGILIGPYLYALFGTDPDSFGLITKPMLTTLNIIVDVALGFIAFSIGGEFKLSALKKLGKKIFVITFFQSFLALVLVDIFLIVLCIFLGQEYIPVAIILGAVATATAPAATLMVIKQYKAHGPVTDTLLPVVALDDAFGLFFFAVSFAIAKVIASGEVTKPFQSMVLLPLIEIVASIVIGLAVGFLLAFCMKFFASRANRLTLMITAVLIGVCSQLLLSKLKLFGLPFETSSLLTCMMIGAVLCNMRDDSLVIMDGVERWTPPLFMLFFVISGAELDFTVMKGIVLIICLVYLVARSFGKYFGSRIGCDIVKMDVNVKKYLGLTLLPQAGVAIGMAHSASASLQGTPSAGVATILTAVVLCATLIYELFGPVITKVALQKAGEIETK